MVTVAVTPAHAMLPATALIIVSAFVARVILRRKRNQVSRKAAALTYGTRLRTPTGTTVTVLGDYAPRYDTGWMWDLTIPGDHDFYIDTAADPVLVHNCPGEGASDRMIGKGGTQVTSRTLMQNEDFHIDVENPNPGVRPGQLHLQDYAGNKYQYNFETGQFEGLPNSLARLIADDPAVARAIANGLPSTKVLLADGKGVAISRLKPGMNVLATNVGTGKTQAETIGAVLVHRDTDLYDLQIRAGTRTAVIDTTSSHLFWTPATSGHGGRWVKAAALTYGTRLRTPTGSTATVLGGYTPGHADERMWDLTIPGDHDFYIGTFASAILVHNAGCDPSIPTGRRGSPMDVPRGTNHPTIIDGKSFSGHAIDEMQSDGITPSVVNDTLATGESAPSRGGTTVYYNAENNISVVLSANGNVITVSYGDLRP